MGSGFQSFLQSPDFYLKSVPGDLYHRLQGTSAQADHCGCSCKALIADHAGFSCLSIFHYDYERNQTSIREIRDFDLSTGLVKDQMVGQTDVFEVRAE